jgi:hypothetical protein
MIAAINVAVLNRLMPKSSVLLAVPMIVAQLACPAAAHEFWLEPEDFMPKIGQSVPISILIGQNFKGNSYPYLREEYIRFVVTDQRGETPVKGVDGDDPALNMRFARAGLTIFSHFSTPETLTFDTLAEFEKYLEIEGLRHIKALHLDQGKPLTRIVERYSRCAKLLMNPGSGGGGSDRFTGMPLELVAERNPYALAPGEPLPVRLFRAGRPIADVQITAFSKADPTARQLVRTDAEGRAQVALPRAGPWLLNAVHMEAPQPGDGAHWASLWASLTFARP